MEELKKRIFSLKDLYSKEFRMLRYCHCVRRVDQATGASRVALIPHSFLFAIQILTAHSKRILERRNGRYDSC